MDISSENSKHIKIILQGGVGGPIEAVWAEDLGNNTAKIENAPFTEGFAFHDIVSFNPATGRVIKLIERTRNQGFISYEPGQDVEANQERYDKICTYLEEKDVLTEGLRAGLIGIAPPIKMTREELQKIIDECPEKISLEE